MAQKEAADPLSTLDRVNDPTIEAIDQLCTRDHVDGLAVQAEGAASSEGLTPVSENMGISPALLQSHLFSPMRIHVRHAENFGGLNFRESCIPSSSPMRRLFCANLGFRSAVRFCPPLNVSWCSLRLT